MKKKPIRKSAFEENVKILRYTFGINTREALQDIQKRYDKFKDRNERKQEHQNDHANAAQISFTNQVTLLCTAILTFSGAFIATVYNKPDYTLAHTWLFIVIVVTSSIALTLALVDYVRTINFHESWAKIHGSIDKKTNEKFESGELQFTSELNNIENEYIKGKNTSIGKYSRIGMMAFSLLSLWLFLLLVAAYLINFPFGGN